MRVVNGVNKGDLVKLLIYDEAKELRRFVNYMESVVLYEYVE